MFKAGQSHYVFYIFYLFFFFINKVKKKKPVSAYMLYNTKFGR